MESRFLQRKMEVSVNEDSLGLNNLIELDYFLLESKINNSDELNGKTTYGIEIVKKVNADNVEIAAIKNISCRKESIQEILDKLAVNTVTPVGLPYIIEDLIGA